MTVIYPTADITKTTASTAGVTIAGGDIVFVKDDIEIAATGTGVSPALGGNNVANAEVTIAGTLFSAYSDAIRLTGTSGTAGSTNNRIEVTEDGLVAGGGTGIYLAGSVNYVVNHGHVTGSDYAMQAFTDGYTGSNQYFGLNNTGLVSGTVRAAGQGGTAAIVNSGLMEGGQPINVEGLTLQLDNSGAIHGQNSYDGSVMVVSAGARINNTGEITGPTAIGGGIGAFTGDQDFFLTNSGLIEGEGQAIQLKKYDYAMGDWTATIVNSGTIVGGISLGDGDDLYDGRDGLLSGFLFSADGADTLLGGRNGENMNAGSGDDIVEGGAGNDTLSGGGGDDDIEAGEGDDLVIGGNGADFMDGGAGADTLSYQDSYAGVSVDLSLGEAFGLFEAGDVFLNFEALVGSGFADTLTGSATNDTIGGGAGNDQITGGLGADQLRGNAGADTLSGGDGADLVRGMADNDLLRGGAGADTLRGEGGNDTLLGGAEADMLFGGLGADAFRFAALTDSPNSAARDRIMDFSHGQGDVIDLSLLDAKTGTAGDQAFDFIEAAAFSGVAGQLRQSASGANTLLTGDVNGDKVADFSILVMGAVTFVDADFVL